mmetsp:Transcript_6631/g.16875  ORF Transcript_6631/g.16875 Transcript_6631/m.16875 type:complete len:166 (-) Transcript_6631:717-1214(-)
MRTGVTNRSRETRSIGREQNRDRQNRDRDREGNEREIENGDELRGMQGTKQTNRKRKLIAVEFPGHVVDVDRAIDAMGGTRAISSAFCSSSSSSSKSEKLKIRFGASVNANGNDYGIKTKHAIQGERRKVDMAVVKVVRCENDDVKTEVVGHVDETFVFETLADF